MKKPLSNNTAHKKANASKSYNCPNCYSSGMSIFHEQKSVPVHSVLNMPTRETALNYPKGDILLGFCQNCGFISNVVFDPGALEYSSNCEESQGCSPTFDSFSRRLANDLIKRHDLHQKDILEIGCGKGEFLTLICELGENRGVGFDPAYVSGRHTSKAKDRITFIKDFYSEKYTYYKADFICCRMTLEHIQDTADFVSMVRRSIGDRTKTIVFFQVPDVTRILRDCAFEDIYYEHCSYFSPESLACLFRKCEFDVLNLQTEYDDQYLIIEVKPENGKKHALFSLENDLEKLKEYVLRFTNTYNQKINTWENKLQDFRAKRQRVVIWGSGSKAVSFLSGLNVYDQIEYVVDINPFRQGSYMAGTGQEIVAPDFLKEYTPDIVIVMNSIYCEEIKHDLNQMGLNPELLTL